MRGGGRGSKGTALPERSRPALTVLLAVLLIIGSPVLTPRLPGDVAVAATICGDLAVGGDVSVLVLSDVEYCLHVFAEDGEFEVLDVRARGIAYLIVGGGGSGASRDIGGGGGAGGLLTGSLRVDAGVAHPVVVGEGGPSNPTVTQGEAAGNKGEPSSAFGVVAQGGGGGAGWDSTLDVDWSGTGGSGGGGSAGGDDRNTVIPGAAGETGQGFAGGSGAVRLVGSGVQAAYGGGGGGGAGGAGQDAEDGRGGGVGRDLAAVFGTDVGVDGVFAGGGGGAGHRTEGNSSLGTGGAGGGGAAGTTAGVAGVANTGGGGGASRDVDGMGGAGGSGVVIVRYPVPSALVLDLDATVDGGVDGATWVDRSGSGRDGTLVGDVTFDTATSSIVFPGGTNGTNFVDLDGSFTEFSNGLTIEFEADLGAAVSFERIFGFAEATGNPGIDNAFALVRLGTTNELALETFSDGSSVGRCHTSTGDTALAAAGFQRWTVTVGVDGVCRMYLDGVLQTTRVTSVTTDVGRSGADADGSAYQLPPVVDRPSTFVGRSNFTHTNDRDFEGSIRYLRIYATERTPASPVAAACDGLTVRNGISITSGHGEVLYINSGQNERIDAGYLAYQVASDTERSDLWVEVTDFSGGVIAPANPSQMTTPLGEVNAGGSRTAFFMVAASAATTTAQSHRVNIYDRRPVPGVTRPLTSCSFTFQQVQETIRANANRVDSITATSAARLGAELVITVEGQTGQIGQGNRIDGRMVWLSPAGLSDWPVSSLRLERVQIDFFATENRNPNQLLSTHVDTLLVNATSSPALSSDMRQFYTASYRFRIIGPAASSAPVVAVAMISSGSQVKHTDLRSFSDGGGDAVDVDLTSTDVEVTLQKDVRTTTTVDEDGTTVTYDLDLVNAGDDDLIVDEIIDIPDDDLVIVPGSVTYDEQVASDPTALADGAQRFSGPFILPSGSTRTLTYEMRTQTCAPGGEFSFTNTATARIGSVVIGSSTATRSVVNLAGDCGVEEAFATVTDEQLDPEVTTGAATAVTQDSATLAGIVDANGDVGSTVRFRIAEQSDLTGPTADIVDVGFTSGAVDPEGVSVEISGLQPDTTYHYRIELERPGEPDIVGATRTFITPPEPAAPDAVTGTATSVTTTSAVLEGTVDANLVEGGAKVLFEWEERATCAVDGSTLGTDGFTSGLLQVDEDTEEDALVEGSSPTTMSHAIDGLEPATGYCFRIVALHGDGHMTRVEGDWMAFTAVERSEQSIAWSPRTEPLPAGGTADVVAVASSGLDVTYTSVDEDICTVDQDGKVTAVATEGTCAITATQDGDQDFAPALPATISFPISPPVIITTALVSGRYGDDYDVVLDAEGGDGTYSAWTVASGALPAGVTLDASSGRLSGTPEAAGTFRLAVTTTSNGVVSAKRDLTLFIARRVLTVTASSATITFGDPAPSITPSYDGLLSGDSVADEVHIVPTCSSDYTVGDEAGSTPTTSCTGGWGPNYTLIHVEGEVTIEKYAITLRALDAAKQNLVDSDGDILEVRLDPDFFFVLSPSLPGQLTIDDVIVDGLGGVSFTRAQSGTDAGEEPGTYAITPVGSLTTSAAKNFTLSVELGTLTIQTPLIVPNVVPPEDVALTYGADLDGALGASAEDGDDPVLGTFSFTLDGETVDSATQLPAGQHSITITFTPTDGERYYGAGTGELVLTSFTVTVEPAELVVRALDAEKLEGTTDPPLLRTIDGLVDASDEGELGAISIERVSGETPGDYAISTSGGSHPDYTVLHETGVLHVMRLRIDTSPSSGVVTSQDVTLSCAQLDPGSEVRLLTLPGPTLLHVTTVRSDGTCPDSITLPDSIADGSVTLRLEGRSRLGNALATEKTFVLSTGRNVPIELGGGVTPPPSSGGGGAAGPSPSPGVSGDGPGDGVVDRTDEEELLLLDVVPGGAAGGALGSAPGDTDAGEGSDAPLQEATPERPPGAAVEDDDLLVLPPIDGAQFLPGRGVGTDDPLATRDVDGRARRPEGLGRDRFEGLDAASGVRVELLGARTVTRFVLTDVSRIDSLAVTRLIAVSARGQATDFVRLDDAVVSTRPRVPAEWTERTTVALGDAMEVVGFAAPVSLADLEIASVRDWLDLTATGDGYLPGSAAHLVLTSSPVVLASTIVGQDGTFRLEGSLPLDVLGPGEHRIRIVGIRQAEGVLVSDGTSIRLTSGGLAEVQRFDPRTRAQVALVGTNPQGGQHVAIRLVNLDPTPPWWTLAIIVVVGLVAGRARRRPSAAGTSRRSWTLPAVLGSSVPAVVLGWTSTATEVIWLGLGLALVTAVGVLSITPEDQAQSSSSPSDPRRSTT